MLILLLYTYSFRSHFAVVGDVLFTLSRRRRRTALAVTEMITVILLFTWSFPLVQLWSCFNEIFGGGRGDKYRLSYKTSPFFQSFNFWKAIGWKCLLKNNCIRVVFDRMLILLWSQDQYQPRIPRLGASSMRCARIALDVVQWSQYVQDLCDFRLKDQQARRILSVFCSNLDLQVSIHCW